MHGSVRVRVCVFVIVCVSWRMARGVKSPSQGAPSPPSVPLGLRSPRPRGSAPRSLGSEGRRPLTARPPSATAKHRGRKRERTATQTEWRGGYVTRNNEDCQVYIT